MDRNVKIVAAVQDVELSLPAVVLDNPKYPTNISKTLRSVSAFLGGGQVWFTGTRAVRDLAYAKRLPREERMKGYKSVSLLQHNRPLHVLDRLGAVPVCVELVPGAVDLPYFEHPENAVYIFGPEDGSVSKGLRHACHYFVKIPTAQCLNLAMAVSVVLYDRVAKLGNFQEILVEEYVEVKSFDD